MRDKLYMILSMLIFGTIGIFVNYIEMPSGVIACARGVVGTFVILIVMLFTGYKADFKIIKKKLHVLLVSGAAIGVNWMLLFEAYRHTGIPVATVCYYTAPIFVVIASPFIFKENLKPKQVVCIVVALIGVISVSGVLQTNGPEITGVLFGIGAAMLYASVMIMNKFMGDVAVYERTVIQLGTAGVTIFPYAVLTGGDIVFTPKSVALLLIVGVVHTGFAYMLYFGAIKKLRSQTVAILSYIDPASAIILSSLVFMQLPTIYEIVGVILIMIAAFFSENKKQVIEPTKHK